MLNGQMGTKYSWKKFLLVICEILGLFVNTLTADGKYSVLKKGNLAQSFRCNDVTTWKCFSIFVAHFLNLDQTLYILRKKSSLRGYVFRELRTAKDVVR